MGTKIEPKYTSLGDELYRLMMQENRHWEKETYMLEAWLSSRNPTIRVRLRTSFKVIVNAAGNCITKLLSDHDHKRLARRYKELQQAVTERDNLIADGKTWVNLLIARAQAPTFDSTSINLAVAVLKGDRVAAKAQFDYLLEHPELLGGLS